LEQPLIPVPRAPVSPAPSRPEPQKRSFTRRRWGLLLLAGWLFQAGLRAWLGRGLAIPLANPDESAYLIAARVLAGGAGANFTYSTLYPAGYPLLISPVFWFTQDPGTAYHAVLLINAMVSALLMPLAYVACRRLGLTSRPLAYGVATATALLPAGFFYSEFAMSDAIFPVIVLAWLLTMHSWLTAPTHRVRYLAAAGSALLTGYSYAVHSRGMVLIVAYLGVLLIMVLWKKCRDSAILAGAVLLVSLLIAWALNQRIKALVYPAGPRSFTAEASIRLGNLHGIVLVLEMAIGQMWRLTLDSWGVAALGMAAVVVAIARSRTPADARIIASLAVAITLAIAITTPAALPSGQGQVWASGRYLDCMIVTFFLPGMVVLRRAGPRRVLLYAACVAPPTLIAALVIDAYAGSSLPTHSFGTAFNFGEPAVLTQNWNSANVALATAVGLGLLAVSVAVAVLLPKARVLVLLAGLTAVSVTADVQMTHRIGDGYEQAAREATVAPLAGLKQGEKIAISNKVIWEIEVPEMYEMPWKGEVIFHPSSQAPPAGVSVVEVPWQAGQSEQASWPTAPPGWHITAGNQTAGWVIWQAPSPTS
jgi:hypothetical protein